MTLTGLGPSAEATGEIARQSAAAVATRAIRLLRLFMGSCLSVRWIGRPERRGRRGAARAEPLEDRLEVARLHLIRREAALDERQLQDRAEDGAEDAVARE